MVSSTRVSSMLEENSDSDDLSLDSDEELQEAFAAGKLKSGLNVELPAPKQFINNVSGIQQKLKDFRSKLDWIERLDLTNDPAPARPGMLIEGDDDIHNDFKRELKFYRQAQASVLVGIPKLHKLNIETKRPEDYYAQMAKSDDHMKRVRERIIAKQIATDRSEKAKKLRELRKYGKKVQQEVLLKRQKEKKEMLDAVKKYRKGQKDKIDFLDDLEPSNQKQPHKKKDDKSMRPNKKREFKNKKFGFGGQKKRSKQNTKASASNMDGFDPKINQSRPGKAKMLRNKNKNKRPGKSKRQKVKSKKR